MAAQNVDNVSELAPLFKTRAPRQTRKLDPYGKKFAKGHRTFGLLSGQRPTRRAIVRAR